MCRARRRRAAARDGVPRRPWRRRPSGTAVERHPVRGRGRRARRGARRSDRGWPGVGRRRRQRAGGVVHGDEAALARRARTRQCREDRVGLPAARLADLATWRRPLGGALGANALATDRGDASGTGYFSPATGEYRLDLFDRAFGRAAALPGILGPAARAGHTPHGRGPRVWNRRQCRRGARRCARLRATSIVSIGTSGTVFAGLRAPGRDPSGTIAGFADATGRFLPLVCTLNAARVLDSTARLLGVDQDGAVVARSQRPSGRRRARRRPVSRGRADSESAVRNRRGPRPPPRHLDARPTSPVPRSRACCAVSPRGSTPCSLSDVHVERVILIGGASRSEAVRRIAPGILGRPVVVPEAAQHVAIGAARQAAWALSGEAAPPMWSRAVSATYEAEPLDFVRGAATGGLGDDRDDPSRGVPMRNLRAGCADIVALDDACRGPGARSAPWAAEHREVKRRAARPATCRDRCRFRDRVRTGAAPRPAQRRGARGRGGQVPAWRHRLEASYPAIEELPPDTALQDPGDYLEVLYRGIPEALRGGGRRAEEVIGIGIDFTACTVLPVTGGRHAALPARPVAGSPPCLGEALEAPFRAADRRSTQCGRGRTRRAFPRPLRRAPFI